MTLYLQEGRGLSLLLTGLCFVPQVAGAFALAGRDRRGNDSMMREVARGGLSAAPPLTTDTTADSGC